jgi:hypothetical protein
MEAVKLEPPALMKGRVFPAKGNRPTITAMLMMASIAIQKVSPAATSVPRMSGAFWAIRSPRQMMTP